MWDRGNSISGTWEGGKGPRPGDRLPKSILDLIVKTTEGLGEASELIKRQAQAARVVRFSPTNIDVVVPGQSELIPLSNGPITSYGIVNAKGDIVGQVLIWVAKGIFIGMEQDWYTEETPEKWPLVEDIRWGS